MCTPMLAVAAISTVASTYAQQQAAQAQADAQNAYNRQMERNALVARNANLANLELERNALIDDTTEQVNQNNLAARRAQSTAYAAAGEAGVSGLSVDSLLRDLAGQAGYDNATAELNYLRQDASINVRRENTQNEQVSTLNSIRQPHIQGANWLGAGLKIGQDYLGYQHQRNIKLNQ